MTGIGKSTLLTMAMSSLILVAGCGGKIAADAEQEPGLELCDEFTYCGAPGAVQLACNPPEVPTWGALTDAGGCPRYYCCPPSAFQKTQ